MRGCVERVRGKDVLRGYDKRVCHERVYRTWHRPKVTTRPCGDVDQTVVEDGQPVGCEIGGEERRGGLGVVRVRQGICLCKDMLGQGIRYRVS